MSSFFAEAIETLEALVWAVNHGCGSPIPDDEYDRLIASDEVNRILRETRYTPPIESA